MDYIVVKWLHILSSTVLFGTGLGSAFYMFFASRTRDPRVAAAVVRYVVVADWIFTTPTLVLQPASGFYLLHRLGLPFTSRWILWSLILFCIAGLAWLPVVWMQIRMREMAKHAAEHRTDLPAQYWQFLRRWVGLGVVAFVSLIIVFFLMVSKPL